MIPKSGRRFSEKIMLEQWREPPQERPVTSISSSSLLQAYQSPRDRLQTTLESQIASGAIGQTDATALSTALDSIDATLSGERQSGAKSNSQPPSPDQMKSKIDSLMASQVDSGTLTSDQASELSKVFSEAFANGPGGAQGGGKAHGSHRGHGGAGGPNDTPTGAADTASSDGTTTSTAGDATQMIQDFLKLLQETQSSKSPQSYAASGDSVSTASNAALVLDYQS
jgi:hypothetical protein